MTEKKMRGEEQKEKRIQPKINNNKINHDHNK